MICSSSDEVWVQFSSLCTYCTMCSSSSFLPLPYPIAISKCTFLQFYGLADKQPNNIMIYRWHILQMTYPCCSSQHAKGKNTNLIWQETVNFNVWTLLCTPQFDIQSSFHLPLSGVLTIGVAAQLGWAPCYFNSPALCCVLFHTHTRNKISLRMVKTK